MQPLIFAAFSLLTVPAYIAMFNSKELDILEDDADETCTSTEKAVAPERCEPASGLFPSVHSKCFM